MCSIQPEYENLKVKSKILFHTPQYPKGYFLQQTVEKVIRDGYMSLEFMIHTMIMLKDICDSLLSNEGRYTF